MILFKKADQLTKYLRTKSENGAVIGFVPTMGALHKGHLQLIAECRSGSSLCVASIFVNPTQFNDPADYQKYPVTIEADIAALEIAGCDVLFLPSAQEVYPHGMQHLPVFELGQLEHVLEGHYRPGHFQGVCQVMDRLLQIVMPHRLFMGSKDYQQCMVIRRLIELRQWRIDLQLVNTVREPSGLAMSSRNARLTTEQKAAAAVLYRSLLHIKNTIRPGNTEILIQDAKEAITLAGFEKTDYVSVAHADTLAPLAEWNLQTPAVALVAAFIGGVRLIDNLPLSRA